MSDLAGKRVAIANRGEIAVRIAATCTRLSMIPILLIGKPDLGGYALRQVGRFELIGEAGSELDVTSVIAAAKRARSDYLHPGYGFLSERPALAEACETAGIRFVGPSAATLRLCGDKLATRAVAERAGVPVVRASDPLDDDPDHWRVVGKDIGYPLMVKPAEAGGGRGLRLVTDEAGLVPAVEASRRESAASGAGAVIYLERALIQPRHVEVQVVADHAGAFALGDRDCSLQRRHQKVIEEAPAPHVSDTTRQALHEYGCRVAKEAGLRGIATCEFLLDKDAEIAFLEVNPRIQVEHPVTELVTGVDLVEWQLQIASGACVPSHETPEPRGHAIEARVYAEDPDAGFLPTAGALGPVAWPAGPAIRVDAGYGSGDTVPTAYDAMLAKIVGHGADRADALSALQVALCDTVVSGVTTNIGWLLNLLGSDAVRDGLTTTTTAATIERSRRPPGMAPVAAVAQQVDRASSVATDPWSAIGPWRASGRATIIVHGVDWEMSVTIWRDATGWQAALDGFSAPVRWWRGPDRVWTIGSEARVVRFAVVEREGTFLVYGNGGHWPIWPGPKPAKSAGTHAQQSDGQVLAPLPATVIQVHVTEGDQVTKGQPLVTLSAMKMELVCESPDGGRIASVSCREGDLVAADQLLVKLDRTAEVTDG
jgi:acetyl/propionyl-CoA carboxylase alpha subunit